MKKTNKKINNKYGKAKVITATNVFAHIDQLNNLIRDIKNALTKEELFLSRA